MGKGKRNKRSKSRINKIVVRRGGKKMNKLNQVQGVVGATTGTAATTNQSTTVVRPAVKPGFQTTRPWIKPAPPAPTFWETDLPDEMITSCGAMAEKATVLIGPKARAKMTLLMERFPRIEWLAYLVGDKEGLFVEDIAIPKQRVTAVNVYVDEPVDVPIMGVIHSHHDMGNGFSGTDDDYINQNHDLSLCITNTKITGQLRVKTECGRYMLADVVVYDSVEGFEPVEFLKEVDAQISEIKYTTGYGYNRFQNRVTPVNQNLSRTTGATGNVLGSNRSPMFGNSAGWEDQGDGWDTVEPSGNVKPKASRDLLQEIDNYKNSIHGLSEVDEFYIVEFTMLSNLIHSIGGHLYDVWETKAFDATDNAYTEQYYTLIDEISLFSEELRPQEKTALLALASELDKRCEVSNPTTSTTSTDLTTLNSQVN